MPIARWIELLAKRALPKSSRPVAIEIGIAAASLLAATMLKAGLETLLPQRVPYITFFPATIVTALFCRFSVTMVFVVAAALIGTLWISGPGGEASLYQVLGASLFIVTATLIVLLMESLKAAYRQIEANDRQLRILNQELLHRIRNLIHVVSAVVAHSIPKEERSKGLTAALMGRLRALQAAQSLLAITSEGFTLLKLIEAALLPLAPSTGRLRTRGEDVILPAQTLSMLALVLNELATNALKYGAWSNAGGEVDLRWTYSGRGIVLEWRERGGPPVELPVREGAGSTLIRAAIPDSIVDFRLEPDGLQCTIAIGLQ